MVSTNDFKTGMTIIHEGGIYSIMEFQHVKPGKGAAFVRTKLRNMRTGGIIDYTFNAGIKIERALIEKEEMQYIYESGDNYVFMNTETYDQVEISKVQLTNELKYLSEGLTVQVISHQGEIIGVNLPDKVSLKVTKSDPAIKGDTKTNAMKDAIVSTGYQLKVPMFIEEEEVIIINTQTGEYVSREK